MSFLLLNYLSCSASQDLGQVVTHIAARVKSVQLLLTAKCQGDFLIHCNKISGNCGCKEVVLVATALTLFPRQEVRDLLARVHPLPRW